MKSSFLSKAYRSFGLHIRANHAEARFEERRLLADERRKPENAIPRKVTYNEIMSELATGKAGRYLDRKVQAFISNDNWPPMPSETFYGVEASGADNAWTTSVNAVIKLIMVSHPNVLRTIRIEFAPYRATFTVDAAAYQVRGKSPAMALMMAQLVMSRIRHSSTQPPLPDLGPHVRIVPKTYEL